MQKLRHITNQIGFWQTIEILSQNKNDMMLLESFYKRLKKNSYYNSFYRVRAFLLENKIIFINSKNVIGITTKGIVFWNKVKQANKILEEQQ